MTKLYHSLILRSNYNCTRVHNKRHLFLYLSFSLSYIFFLLFTFTLILLLFYSPFFFFFSSLPPPPFRTHKTQKKTANTFPYPPSTITCPTLGSIDFSW